MHVQLSETVQKELKKIRHTDLKLAKKIEQRLALFQENPHHPSLRLHKLTGSLEEVWSISITRNFRMLAEIEKDSAYFFDLGTHDQVYKK